jgi:hypothetical protein
VRVGASRRFLLAIATSSPALLLDIMHQNLSRLIFPDQFSARTSQKAAAASTMMFCAASVATLFVHGFEQ